MSETAGLYIHIPFCLKKCLYCDFYSLEGQTLGIIDTYISALLKEAGFYRERLRRVNTIYIGGGTPSILEINQLRALLEGLSGYLKKEQIIEFTIEANPKSITREKLLLMKEYGVTRISLGVQSFREEDLLILGRTHTVQEAFRAIEAIKSCSFELSVDLIYGIPGQTFRDWADNLLRLIDFPRLSQEPPIEHISTYELTVEEGTPLSKEIKSGHLRKPPDEELAKIYEYTVGFLEERGYIHYEVSNFAMPARECLHNLNYWKRGEYIGLGAGAHSFLDGERRENLELQEYIDFINKGRAPVKKVIRLTPQDELMEFIMLGLRLSEGIEIDKAPAHENVKEMILSRAIPLIEEGLLEKDGSILRPTLRGFLLLNEVINGLIPG